MLLVSLALLVRFAWRSLRARKRGASLVTAGRCAMLLLLVGWAGLNLCWALSYSRVWVNGVALGSRVGTDFPFGKVSFVLVWALLGYTLYPKGDEIILR